MKAALLCLFCFFCQGLFAQSLQSPSDFLGYELGERFTFHHRIVDYFEHVSAASNNMQLEQYGHSKEGRPLVLAYISAEKNLTNLESYRQNNLALTGLGSSTAKGKNLPIIWLSYNVHGDEASTSEAALATLYSLVTSSKPEIKQWLEKMIIIIDPCLNPDGRDRYTNWFNQVGNAIPDSNPDSYEHHQPWPGGRYNHYLFDLNRDWAWQTQIESQQRVKIYQEWMPQVHVDFHEMWYQAPYFFGPAAQPYNEAITDWQEEFLEITSDQNAAYFDQKGWLYFSNEIFDLFYPSYGDTWPIFNGAIGFTYEQGGSGKAGLSVEHNDELITLKNRIKHHEVTSLATIETAYHNREKLIKEFQSYYDNVVDKIEGPYKSYLISAENNSGNTEALLNLLDKQQIRYSLAKTGTRKKGFSFQKGKELDYQVKENDILVSCDQALGRLVNVLFEPRPVLTDSVTYDLTAWALPYAYNLNVMAFHEALPAQAAAYKKVTKTSNPFPQKETPYAYLIPWDDFQDARVLSRLLQEGVKVRYAEEEFRINGKDYSRGTLVILKTDNQEKPYETLLQTLFEEGSNIDYTMSGKFDKGNGFGSDTFVLLNAPKVALIGGKNIFPSTFGSVWHFFEAELDYPLSIIHTNQVASADFSQFDVIIMSGGGYSGLKITSKLMKFARAGGRIIALDSAVEFFSRESTNLNKQTKDFRNQRIPAKATDEILVYEDRERRQISNEVPGSVYRVELEETHPLAYGLGEQVFLIKRNSKTYPFLTEGHWNVGSYPEDALVSGFVGANLIPQFENSLAIGEETVGAGWIVYFPDSPIFRGFWHSGKLLFSNAIFLN